MSGNKTPSRIIVAVIAIPVIIGVSLFGGYPFLIFAGGVALLGFREFARMLEAKGTHIQKFLGFISIALIAINAYLNLFPFYQLFILIVLSALLRGLRWENGSPTNDIAGTILGVVYLGIFVLSLIGIREFFALPGMIYNNGGWLIISIFVSIWACDSGAFFLGIAFGRHKLYPKVSPKKSWEGAIAGLIFSIAAMIGAKYFILDFLSWPTVISIGFAAGIFGQAGDFVESLFKRDSGVKDSSSIIPGHGGILDRFDSLIFSSPIIYLLLLFLEK